VIDQDCFATPLYSRLEADGNQAEFTLAAPHDGAEMRGFAFDDPGGLSPFPDIG